MEFLLNYTQSTSLKVVALMQMKMQICRYYRKVLRLAKSASSSTILTRDLPQGVVNNAIFFYSSASKCFVLFILAIQKFNHLLPYCLSFWSKDSSISCISEWCFTTQLCPQHSSCAHYGQKPDFNGTVQEIRKNQDMC